MRPGDSTQILIVDDDRQTCLALSFLMESWGYTPHVVHVAEAALALCKQVRFGCVLLDQRLGHSALGTEVLPRFAQLGAMRPRGIVLFTGEPVEQFDDLLRSGEICACLHKPARPSEIRQALDACLACGPLRAQG